MQLKPESKVLIQGITEPFGKYCAATMKAYGTQVVAGVSAGKGNLSWQEIPIFDLVEEAIASVEVDVSVICCPPYQVLDAALEAIAAGVRQLILSSGKVPPSDIVHLLRKAQSTDTQIIGPGSAGILIPDKLLLGHFDTHFYTPGSVGIISRTDDYLMSQVAYSLTQAGLGVSLVVSLGTEGMIGASFSHWLQILEDDSNTKVIVLMGQPHVGDEEAAAEYIAKSIKKPVIACIVGRNSPAEKPLGDATVIIAAHLSGIAPNPNPVQHKITALDKDGVSIANYIGEIPELVSKILKKK